jgi:hypothetical protein
LKRYGNVAETTGKDDKRLAAIARFPRELLKRVDAAAKARGVSPAAWTLDSGEW